MEIYNKIMNILGRVLNFLILGVGLIGIYESRKYGGHIQGGAFAVLIVGFAKIAEMLNLDINVSTATGKNIIGYSLSLLLIFSGINFIRYPRTYYKLLGFIVAGAGMFYLLDIIFHWGF